MLVLLVLVLDTVLIDLLYAVIQCKRWIASIDYRAPALLAVRNETGSGAQGSGHVPRKMDHHSNIVCYDSSLATVFEGSNIQMCTFSTSW